MKYSVSSAQAMLGMALGIARNSWSQSVKTEAVGQKLMLQRSGTAKDACSPSSVCSRRMRITCFYNGRRRTTHLDRPHLCHLRRIDRPDLHQADF